jgi:hypothetical protein
VDIIFKSNQKKLSLLIKQHRREQMKIVDQQLICFSDAREKAYRGAVYLRSKVHVSVVMAKTRVASIKKVSLLQSQTLRSSFICTDDETSS